MRVLIDECVDHRLRRLLVGHEAFSVRYLRWGGIKNGALLALMAQGGFGALLTADRNLRFQQNLSKAGVGLVVMAASNTNYASLAPLMPKVLAALANLQPGDIVEISAEEPQPP